MIKNSNGTEIYLIVPASYEVVYKELLNKLIGDGQDILNDCSCDCKSPNRQLINCWNIFQGACASYALGRYKEANFMIYYITNQLNINIEEMACNPNYIYYGHTDIDPNIFKTLPIEELFNGQDVHFKDLVIDNKEFVITQGKHIHYLMIPSKYMELVSAEYGDGVVTNLWDRDYPMSGVYNTSHPGGVYNGEHYTVYFSYSPIGGFRDPIRIVVDNK